MNIRNLNPRGWHGRFDGKRIVFRVLGGRPAVSKLVGSSLGLQELSLMLEPLETGRSDCDNPGLVTFKERWFGVRSFSSMRCPAGTFQPPYTQNVEATV